MRQSTAQLFSGAGLGLMLGLLLGLSSAPVVAVVVGAIAALLGSIVLPQMQTKPSPDAAEEQRTAIDLRAGALGLACVLGILCGLWLRTHDALSPKTPTLKEKLEQWKSLGFSPEESRVLVARGEGFGPSGAASSAPPAARTILFGDRTTRCEQLSAERYSNVDAAARAYEAMGEPTLARIAHSLSRLPDEKARMQTLAVVVDASCTGA